MVSTTREIIKSSKRLNEAKEEVLSLETAKEELIEEIEYKKGESYIKEIARNELNLIKPGEEIYIYPNEKVKSKGKNFFENVVLKGKKQKPIQAWANLLLH